MQSIMLPKFPQLKGKDAIEVLNNFIKELETGDKELTKHQTLTLKKMAEGIISSIEAEESRGSQKETGFASKLRASIMRRDQKSGGASENCRLWKVTV